MNTTNRRRADRVPVGILAEFETNGGNLAAEVRDLSRTGLRVRAPASAFGLERPVDAEEALASVSEQLRRRFRLSLNHDRLGSLLQRHVELTRVEFPEDAAESFDLCCRYAEPLEDQEAQLLEAHVPPIKPVASADLKHGRIVGGVRLEDTVTEVSVPRPDGRPRQRYLAFVSAARDDALQTFRCHTDLVTGVGVRIAVPRADYGDDVRAAAKAFTRRYGTHLDLRLSDEDVDIWSGRVRVSGTELPRQRDQVMLITLAFDRALALNELRGLGLLTRAA